MHCLAPSLLWTCYRRNWTTIFSIARRLLMCFRDDQTQFITHNFCGGSWSNVVNVISFFLFSKSSHFFSFETITIGSFLRIWVCQRSVKGNTVQWFDHGAWSPCISNGRQGPNAIAGFKSLHKNPFYKAGKNWRKKLKKTSFVMLCWNLYWNLIYFDIYMLNVIENCYSFRCVFKNKRIKKYWATVAVASAHVSSRRIFSF